MKCEIDASGRTHRVNDRNTLTGSLNATPAFGLNITFVAEKNDAGEFEDLADPGMIEAMEREIVAALHEALAKHGIVKPAAEIEI